MNTDTRPNGDARTALGDIISQTTLAERMDSPDPQDWASKMQRIREIARAALAASRTSREAGPSYAMVEALQKTTARLERFCAELGDRQFRELNFGESVVAEEIAMARAALASQPQGVSGWDVARKLAKLAEHAEDCTVYEPLPTGEGTWGCSCGKDSLVLDGELLNEPGSQGVSEEVRQKIIADFLERTGQWVTNEATVKAARDAWAASAPQGVSLPPLTCSRSNRTDCALYGMNESLPSSRPSREWYRDNILTPEMIAAEDAAGGILAAGALVSQGVSLSDERLRELLEAHCDKHEEFDQNGQARWTGAYLIMPESLRSLLSAPGQEGRAAVEDEEQRLALYAEIATDVSREVAELPDRNSPEGQPDMMLVTHAELQALIVNALDSRMLAAAPSQEGSAVPKAWREFVAEIADDTMLGSALREWAQRLLAAAPTQEVKGGKSRLDFGPTVPAWWNAFLSKVIAIPPEGERPEEGCDQFKITTDDLTTCAMEAIEDAVDATPSSPEVKDAEGEDAETERASILKWLEEFIPENGEAWPAVTAITEYVKSRGAK